MKDLTPERLTRLLALITYLADGRQVPIDEAARHFGITREQLLDDVNTLWVSGAPGYTHAELIDFEASAFDHGRIALRESQQMDRPLRLSPSEGVTLLVALNALIARLGPSPLLLSTRDKLRRAAGEAAAAAEAVHLTRTPARTLELRERIEAALEAGTQLRIRYVSRRSEVTERTIDPALLHATDEHLILVAWCHAARGERQFRLDRILELTALDTPVSHHAAGLRPTEMDTTTFDHRVTLTLASPARWVTEQIPVEEVLDEGDRLRVVIASPDPDWLDQLCLRLGETLLAVDPPEAAGRIHAAARAALALYGE